ncbi:endonuclease/exonuclease/phosphatase family protein [Segatella copri]|uniref:endonuclease/exonuclease/phosphatase family protein n=1 Tax=Segatella copri TaxID=165179 RepID=UPI003F7018BC
MFLTLILSSFLTFMELNCENLFDTRHDSLKNDLEFLPDGSYRWTPYRYWAKLNHLGQEIVAQSNPIPDFVAMCEVENDSVMFDLTRRSLLRNAGYEYVMTSSPDERGIDVALLYQPASFSLLHSHSIRIKPLPDTRPTRDILYASGLIITGDTLHVFVVHAPSRRGGELASRPYRLHVASQLAEAVDSVYAISRDAKIIIAGDFNDYADSPALQYFYEHHLINISADAKGSHGAKATYRWHGEWRSLDQILCSPSLAARKQSSVIGDLPFLLEDDEKYGGKKPYRTYLGPRYLGGYSDHLPLVVQFSSH